MLAFLIGTSILNIFLGYALAVYLMRESLTLENHRSQGAYPKTSGAPVADQRERSELYPASAEAASASVQADGLATNSANVPPAPSNSPATISSGDTDPATTETSDPSPEEMDQQLLAGIADFRSQLAKLRSENGSEESKRRPVAQSKS